MFPAFFMGGRAALFYMVAIYIDIFLFFLILEAKSCNFLEGGRPNIDRRI